MPYSKYKKVKKSTNPGSNSDSVKNVDKYIDDDKKTSEEEVKDIRSISDYVENELKVINPKDKQHLVGVINCGAPDTFVAECHAAEKLYHSKKSEHLNPGHTPNEAYHIIVSCKGKDIDPELVFHAGLDIAKALCGEDFAAKVATHLNTDNYHNHIIINAYDKYGTKKFKDEWQFYKKLRTITDEISLKYGFPIIQQGLTDRKTTAESLSDEDRFSGEKVYMADLKKDILEASKTAETLDDMLASMRDKGYIAVVSTNRITYVKDGYAVSDHRLGTRYTASSIEAAIAKRKEDISRKATNKQVLRASKTGKTYTPNIHPHVSKYDGNGNRRPAIIRLLLILKEIISGIGNLFFDPALAQALPDNIRTQSAEMKLAKIDEAIALCEKYGIRTLDGLKEKLSEAGMTSKAMSYKATGIYSATDRMSGLISTLDLEDDLSMIMTSLGISDKDFNIPSYSDEEIKKEYAALDPMTGEQKKQLWNALNNSDYRLQYGFSSLTRPQAEAVISYLNNDKGSTVKPPEIVTKSEYDKDKSMQALVNKNDARVKSLTEKYGKVPASKAQIRLISKTVPPEILTDIDLKGLNKTDALRLLSRYETKTPREILSEKADAGKPLSDWQMTTLSQIKAVYPDDFKGLDLAGIDRKSAASIIDTYLAKADDIRGFAGGISDRKKKPAAPSMDLSKYNETEILCIREYENLLRIKARYGLDTKEKTDVFKADYNKMLAEADGYMKLSMEASDTYKDLLSIRSIVRNAASKAYAFGPLYAGDDTEITKAKEQLSSSKADRLMELINRTDDILKELKSHGINNISVDDAVFEPIPPDVRAYLTAVKNEVFMPGFSNNVNTLSYAEAYEIVTAIKTDQTLEKTLKAVIKSEQSDEWEAEKENSRTRK